MPGHQSLVTHDLSIDYPLFGDFFPNEQTKTKSESVGLYRISNSIKLDQKTGEISVDPIDLKTVLGGPSAFFMVKKELGPPSTVFRSIFVD